MPRQTDNASAQDLSASIENHATIETQFSRTENLIGADAVKKLRKSTVAVFGIGGVGSYAVEALARAGIGHFLLIDNDTVSESNINRQLLALHSTIGQKKVDVAKLRILDINPNAQVDVFPIFYLADTASQIDLTCANYIIDCIDTVSAKILLAETAQNLNIPIISAMGTGNKTDATKFIVTDIYKTSVCPLARVMRYELKKRGIKKLKVVYSTAENAVKKNPPASISYVPSVAGLLLAGEVIKYLSC